MLQALISKHLFSIKTLVFPVINVLLIASFWSSGYGRAGITLISYLIAAVMMIVLVDYAPNSYVPQLVHYYEYTLVLSSFAFVLFVLDRCLDDYAPQCLPYGWLTRCMASASIRMAFGLDDPLVSGEHVISD